jgi:cytoskeletal protein CcmA (bactofilin family)
MVALKGPRCLIVLAAVVCAALLLGAPAARAAEIANGDVVRVGVGEQIDDDLYAQAAEVTIDGTVRGDVIVVAEHLVINGNVDGSVWALARTVQLNGRVAGSLRTLGISLALGAPASVDRDVVVGGYSVTTAYGSSIRGDVLAWTYQALHAGSIARNYLGRNTALELDGGIGGYARVEVGGPTSNTSFNPAYVLPDVSDVPTVARGLTIGNQAHIAEGITILDSETPAPPPGAPQQVATSLLDFSRGLIPLLVTSVVLSWIWPRRLVVAADTAAGCPGASLGCGIALVVGVLLAIYCIVIVALAVVAFSVGAGLPGLAVTISGALVVSAGGTLFALFVLWALVSKVVLGFALITRVKGPVLTRASNTYPRLAGLIGTVMIAGLLALTASIPLVGVALDSLIALVGIGALVLAQAPHVLTRSLRIQSVSPRSAL